MRREKGKFFISIVQGNPVTKSESQWENRQAKVKKNAFANRTDALLRSGITRENLR